MLNATLGIARRASAREVAFFTSQLALMLEAGTSLTDALASSAEQTSCPTLRNALEEIQEDVKGGKLLSTALEKHPRQFPTLLTSMVRVGETGGFLPDALHRTSEFLLLRQELLARIQAALAYPVVLVVISAGVVLFLVGGVLPKFVKVFEGREQLLPLPTKILMGMSAAIGNYWYAMLAAAAVVAGALAVLQRSPSGRRAIDRWLLRVPLVGPLWKLGLAARLMRTMGVLIESGVPLLEAVAVARRTISHTEFGQFFDRLHEIVQHGGTLGEAFSRSQLFPATVKQMIATGEATGTSGKIMLKAAEYYEGQVALRLKSLTAALEPLVLLMMGSIVGFIALSLFMPLFRMARTV